MGALSSYSNGESGSQDRGLKGAKEPPTGVGQRAGSGASGAGGRMFPREGHDHQRVGEGLCERGGGWGRGGTGTTLVSRVSGEV